MQMGIAAEPGEWDALHAREQALGRDRLVRQALLTQMLGSCSADFDAMARHLGVSRSELDLRRSELLAEARRLIAPELPGWSLSRRLFLIKTTLDAADAELAQYARALSLAPSTLHSWRRGYWLLLDRNGARRGAKAIAAEATGWEPPRRLAFA